MSEKVNIHDHVELESTDELIPYHQNPKEHSDKHINKLASLIQEYGFVQPIVINENGKIVIGHGRLYASEKLGLEKVPVICLSDLSEAQIKALRIADNKSAEESPWDEELLQIEIEHLQDVDFDTELTGFEDSEIDELMEDEGIEEPDDMSDDIEDEYQIIINFDSEVEMEKAYHELEEEGYNCQTSIL